MHRICYHKPVGTNSSTMCAWEVYQETDAKTELDMQETY